jgi:tetratricopeptide (TPR) repeat protein
LLESGHPADAIAPLRIAIKENSENEAAEGYLGDAEMEQSNFALAAETFQAAVARAPNSEQALMWWTDYSLERYRVLAFWLRGSQRGRAIVLRAKAETMAPGTAARQALLRETAEADPEQHGIWGELGVAQIQLGMNTDAETSLKAALARQPEDSSTLQLQALIAAAHGKWPEAQTKLLLLGERSDNGLQKVLATWPQKLVPGPDVDGPVWRCLRKEPEGCPVKTAPLKNGIVVPAGQAYQEGRWEQLASMPAPAPDDASEWFWRGMALAHLRDCPRAIPALERGLKAGAETAGSWLANCYQLEAVHFADQLGAQGKEGSVHQIRGDILLSIRLEPARAATEYTEALRLKPNSPELLEKLAEAYLNSGEMDRARQSAQAALMQNPHRELALRLLIRIAMSDRDYPTALALLGRLAEMEPQDPWTHVQLGTAYAQTGHPEEAVQNLKPVLDSGYLDERGALHGVLAAQLRKLGRDKEAKNATDEAIELATSFQEHVQSNTNIDEHK